MCCFQPSFFFTLHRCVVLHFSIVILNRRPRTSSFAQLPPAPTFNSPAPHTHNSSSQRLGKYILRTKRTPVSLVRAAHALVRLLAPCRHDPASIGRRISIGARSTERVNLRRQQASFHGGRKMKPTSLRWRRVWCDWVGCGQRFVAIAAREMLKLALALRQGLAGRGSGLCG